jgi:hypothetical protein
VFAPLGGAAIVFVTGFIIIVVVTALILANLLLYIPSTCSSKLLIVVYVFRYTVTLLSSSNISIPLVEECYISQQMFKILHL